MTIYEDTNSKPLLDLLDRIHSGDMVLPDFQRDFVWEPSATQALIVSIANNYPAGSILRVRDRQRAFSSRAFEGAPPPTTSTPSWCSMASSGSPPSIRPSTG